MEYRDRRDYLRVPLRIGVEVQRADRKKTYECEAENVSSQGMFLRTRKRFRPGETIIINFTLPDGTGPLQTDATVVYLIDRKAAKEHERERGIGLKFGNASTNVLEAIEEFVEQSFIDAVEKGSQ